MLCEVLKNFENNFFKLEVDFKKLPETSSNLFYLCLMDDWTLPLPDRADSPD